MDTTATQDTDAPRHAQRVRMAGALVTMLTSILLAACLIIDAMSDAFFYVLWLAALVAVVLTLKGFAAARRRAADWLFVVIAIATFALLTASQIMAWWLAKK